MTETEDLQEKYRGKHGELNPAVPLAADAAHLLTEYLDTIAVEFVRHGIAEPYRITREYEEIFVQELQRLGKKGKLTYEVTSDMLDRYGQPQEVVRNYIADHDLLAEKILGEPKITTKTPDDSGSWKNGSRSYHSDNSTTSHYMKISLIVLSFLTAIGYEIINLFNLGNYFNYLQASLALPIFFIPFMVMEIVTGRFGTYIRPKYYNFGREITRFLLSSHVIIASLVLFDINIYYSVWSVIIPSWLVIYGIGWIKDHTDILQSSAPSEKPIARFFLPSYILLGVTYGIASVMLYFQSDSIGAYTSLDEGVFYLLVLGGVSLLLDFRRKYPLSIKKIGYTVLLGVVPFLAFSYGTFSLLDRTYLSTAILSYMGIWLFACTIIIALLFREEIKNQLHRYRLQLNDYQS